MMVSAYCHSAPKEHLSAWYASIWQTYTGLLSGKLLPSRGHCTTNKAAAFASGQRITEAFRQDCPGAVPVALVLVDPREVQQ